MQQVDSNERQYDNKTENDQNSVTENEIINLSTTLSEFCRTIRFAPNFNIMPSWKRSAAELRHIFVGFI